MRKLRAAQAFALSALYSGAAAAQTVPVGGGGAGGLGLFQTAEQYIMTNFAEGIIVFGVAALGIMLLMLHITAKHVAFICTGAVVLANCVAIGAGVVSLQSLTSL